MKQEAQLLPW